MALAATYDLTKPRFTVHTHRYPDADFEVLSPAEVKFWTRLGYAVSEARWNGKIFKDITKGE